MENTFNNLNSSNKSKKIKILVISAVVLVLIPAIYLVLDNRQVKSQLIPDQKIVTIEYVGDEFVPSYVKITKDTKVVWVNKDSEKNTAMSISANATPQKTPKDFGSKGGQGLNGTYAYTFEKEGLINYRNTTSPTVNGSIEVVKD